MQDWLKDTAEKQRDVHGYDFASMTIEDKINYIVYMAYALEDEVHEAVAETGWKPWATSRHINREAFIGECVDIGHFLANLLVAVDCTDEEWAAAYSEKARRNKKRQEDGYTGLDKCASCKRAFDDIAAKTSERLDTLITPDQLKVTTGQETVCLPCARGVNNG